MRLFFALWPDAELRASLARLVIECTPACGGRPVPARNLHVTLAFLGEVHPERLATLCRIGAKLYAAPFELALDRLAWFRRSRIVYAGASHVPAALAGLATAAQEAFAATGFRTEARAFVPHVTLIRDARAAPPATVPIAPLLWQVRHIVLVESVSGPNAQMYRVIRRFILRS